MTEAGTPAFGAPPHGDGGGGADDRAVSEITQRLRRSFNGYLRTHPGTHMPEAFMAVLTFALAVFSDQADRMALSPEQRESYYDHALATLSRAMRAEVDRLARNQP